MHPTFELPPQLDAVDDVVQALRAEVEPVLGSLQAMAFEVAVSEALTNIVAHGHTGVASGADAGVISIQLSKQGAVVRLDIRDQGQPGPSDLYERAPSLDDIDMMQESGRGLALIRHHCDAVTYTPSADGNLLVLSFRSTHENSFDGGPR